MPQVGAVVEIPQQIALANIALRLQHRLGGACDEFFVRATNEWMAVGGVVLPDLLALPPAAKKVRGCGCGCGCGRGVMMHWHGRMAARGQQGVCGCDACTPKPNTQHAA